MGSNRVESLMIVTFAIIVSGCVTPAPKMGDPLAEFSVSRGTDNINLRALKGQQLALVLSENTRNIIAWQKLRGEELRSSIGAAITVTEENRKSLDAGLDPKNIVLRASYILKRHFPDLVVVNGLSAAERNYAAAIILDIQHKQDNGAGLIPSATLTWEAGLYFVNTSGSRATFNNVVANKSGSVTGLGNEFVRQFNMLNNSLRDEVLNDLDAKLASALR